MDGEFSEFRKSDKSLKQELGLVWRSLLLLCLVDFVVTSWFLRRKVVGSDNLYFNKSVTNIWGKLQWFFTELNYLRFSFGNLKKIEFRLSYKHETAKLSKFQSFRVFTIFPTLVLKLL